MATAQAFQIFSYLDSRSIRALSVSDKILKDLTEQASRLPFFRSCLPFKVYFAPDLFPSHQRAQRDLRLNIPAILQDIDPPCQIAKVRVITNPVEICNLHFTLKDEPAFDLNSLFVEASKVLSSEEFSDEDREACQEIARHLLEKAVNKWEKADVGKLLTNFIKHLAMPSIPLSKKKAAIQGLPRSKMCDVPFYLKLEDAYAFLVNPDDLFLKSRIRGWIKRFIQEWTKSHTHVPVDKVISKVTSIFADDMADDPSYRPYLNSFFEIHLPHDQDPAKYFSSGNINELGVAFMLEKMGFLTVTRALPAPNNGTAS